ncbi:MAG: pantoate--beta-alanine ligase [Coxiella sp. DG_40]|nr:MAG: pantoate--beta-alanine ligase [Coxiella sp. DG_40]
MTELITSITKWHAIRANSNNTIGFIATMGNLHLGHQSLLERSIKENKITVLSIFVNPTQFDDKEDLISYPKTFERDFALAEKLQVDYVLVPKYEDLYPDNYKYRVAETDFSRCMEGKHRPNHFDGVLTIVMKLLMLVKPNRAYFGEKDFQQLQLVTGMVKAFFLDIEIISCPTVRDKNGLALSSRNNFLTKQQYEIAAQFPKLLAMNVSLSTIIQRLKNQGFSIDYVEEHNGQRFAAVRLGKTRLIDNITM